jgi:hypothetical protein
MCHQFEPKGLIVTQDVEHKGSVYQVSQNLDRSALATRERIADILDTYLRVEQELKERGNK